MTILGKGEPAPDFTLRDLEGQPHTLSAGPWPTLLVFMKSTCGTCQFTAPYVQRLRETVPRRAARILLVMEDGEAEAREFATRHGLSGPVLLEQEPWAVSAAYGLESVPGFFLVEEGTVVSTSFQAFQRDPLAEIAADLARRGGHGSVRFFEEGEVPVLRPG